MHSTRRQKAKAGESRVLDKISGLDNMDVMIGNESINRLE